MTLSPGSRLGAYEVLSAVGSGGMGEVYRARDTRLGREVAIKVLPAEWVEDERRGRRLLHEAKALSTLNHPHIVTVHEIESDHERDFIVMELVDGTSLQTLIPEHGAPPARLLQLAIPIADALAAAHARGIVHGDLKPANVMVRRDGTIKVLDFGLARLADADLDGPPDTVTDLLALSVGRIAGTAAYMAPEQATGGRVDARSDIFSFGAMLYEIVTGTRAFEGASTAETLAAVVRAEPIPLSRLAPRLPRDLERLILRCLRREPERRYQTMLDVKTELEEIKEGLNRGRWSRSAAIWHNRRVLVAAALVASVMVAGAGTWFVWRQADGPLAPMQVLPLTTLDGYEVTPTLSPDGNQAAFSWNGDKQTGNFDVYVTILGSPGVRRVTTDPGMDLFPSWSSDGRQIAFVRGVTDHAGRVYVTSPLGGEERKLSDLDVYFDRSIGAGQLSWSPDGRYIAAGRSSSQPAGESTGIQVIATDTGLARRMTHATAPDRDSDPAFSLDGRRLAYLSCNHFSWRICDVAIVDLDSNLVPTSPGRRITSIGAPMDGLAWAPDGRMVIFSVYSRALSRYLWRADADGRRPPERLDAAGLGARQPAVVPSRNRLVFASAREDSDIYQIDGLSAPRPVLVSSFADIAPALSPDGRQIAFSSSRSGDAQEIWVAGADGSNPHRLTHGLAGWQSTPSWAPDNRVLAFNSGYSIWTVDVDGANLRHISGTGTYRNPTWSRDGRWIYVGKDDAGGQQIRRIRLDNGREEHIASGLGAPGPGTRAFETADGKSLVYVQSSDRHGAPLMIVSLATQATRQLVPCAHSCSVGPAGVYYYPCRSAGAPLPWSPDRSIEIRLIDPDTGVDRRISTLPDLAYSDLFWGPVISPDGGTILYAKDMIRGQDLMLIENFR